MRRFVSHILIGHLFNYQTILQSSVMGNYYFRKYKVSNVALLSGGLLSLMCKPDLYTNMHITGHHGGTNTTLQKSDLGTNTAS